ncbi:hypothetical protein [Candidatus Nanohalovita haloferacivicina]|uniref:hypothetical protein n=1 Tax=Candidatus Nanohalovita haloferacivicina TaxID=2978046 RepID=UPI00325FC9DD|nr:hypothetical protein HBNXNv_0397 [Candidatus Nanohalobia archaeon BNXNv]
MNRTYAEASITLTLGLLTVITGYIAGFSRPAAYFMILPICASFGFAAYISSEGFNKASLTALPLLVFALLGGPTAIYAGITAVGVVLTSVFAGGEKFRSYYASTRVPLAVIGVGLSVIIVFTVMTNAGLQQKVTDTTADLVGSEAERALNKSNVVSSQRQQYKSLVGSTANTTIIYTKAYVLNDTRDDLSGSDLQAVNTAFDDARDRVSERMTNSTASSAQSLDVSERVSDVVKGELKGMRFLIFIPFILSSVMLMQPVIGLLTALFAKIYATAETKLI